MLESYRLDKAYFCPLSTLFGCDIQLIMKLYLIHIGIFEWFKQIANSLCGVLIILVNAGKLLTGQRIPLSLVDTIWT